MPCSFLKSLWKPTTKWPCPFECSPPECLQSGDPGFVWQMAPATRRARRGWQMTTNLSNAGHDAAGDPEDRRGMSGRNPSVYPPRRGTFGRAQPSEARARPGFHSLRRTVKKAAVLSRALFLAAAAAGISQPSSSDFSCSSAYAPGGKQRRSHLPSHYRCLGWNMRSSRQIASRASQLLRQSAA